MIKWKNSYITLYIYMSFIKLYLYPCIYACRASDSSLFLFPHSKTVIVCDGVVTCPGGFSVFPLNPYLDTFQVPSVLNTNKP